MEEQYNPENVEAGRSYSIAIKELNIGKINLKRRFHENIEIGIKCGMTVSQIHDALNETGREFYSVSELINQ